MSGNGGTPRGGSGRPVAPGPRRGLVLGAGGVLGAAWLIGALAAVEDVEGFDPRAADVLQGTSAGAVLVAMLGAGLSVQTLRDHQQGIPLPGGLEIDWDHDRSTGGPTPQRPPLRVGSPALVLRASRGRVPARTGLWGLLPPGRGRLDPLVAVVEQVVGGSWVDRDGIRILAVDYRTGERVAFGAPGAPSATLGAAVAASCAIPGWYAPVVVDGRPYVDGGTRSSTSIDLLAADALDELYVLAPLASFVLDRPTTLAGRLERGWRRVVTRRVLAEARAAQDAGTRVTLLCPGPEDLAVMGSNLMDPARRMAVLETSLRTSAAALRDPDADDLVTRL